MKQTCPTCGSPRCPYGSRSWTRSFAEGFSSVFGVAPIRRRPDTFQESMKAVESQLRQAIAHAKERQRRIDSKKKRPI